MRLDLNRLPDLDPLHFYLLQDFLSIVQDVDAKLCKVGAGMLLPFKMLNGSQSQLTPYQSALRGAQTARSFATVQSDIFKVRLLTTSCKSLNPEIVLIYDTSSLPNMVGSTQSP